MTTTGIPALRTWQKAAHSAVSDVWATDVSAKALVAACPGAGKTLFFITLFLQLVANREINFAIVVVPTTNIQLQWVAAFEKIGVIATSDASNAALKWRKDRGVDMREGRDAVVLTYAQLAKESELIAELARRSGKTLLGADEVHHADDDAKYGQALGEVAEACDRTLALSGTPFNTTGGVLALCECEAGVDDEGKPVRRTVATYTYNYGNAISDLVCRPVEFIKVYGKGEATYRLLNDNTTFQRITDLAAQRKADRIAVLLDPDGAFMDECARQAVRALAGMREAGDRRAAMLVVAKSKEHGAQMAKLMSRVCAAEEQSFLIQEIYNDTPKAHARIEELQNDTTDIIISVRMISEGVDIKRLRVGLFATDWMTRMFFVQFVGRFIRQEDRLDREQFACVVIPAHVLLLKYAREIEEMVEAAAIVEDPAGEGGERTKLSEFLGATTHAGDKGVVYRSEESMKLDLAEALFRQAPSARGAMPSALAIKIAEELHLDGASPSESKAQKIDWGTKNDLMVRSIVKRRKGNGEADEDLFSKVQSAANRAVGIHKKDKLTADDVLIRRHAWLQQWLLRIIRGQDTSDYDAS